MELRLFVGLLPSACIHAWGDDRTVGVWVNAGRSRRNAVGLLWRWVVRGIHAIQRPLPVGGGRGPDVGRGLEGRL